MPNSLRCSTSASIPHRPLAGRSRHLEGTQPRFTQVPPMSRDSTDAVTQPVIGPRCWPAIEGRRSRSRSHHIEVETHQWFALTC